MVKFIKNRKIKIVCVILSITLGVFIINQTSIYVYRCYKYSSVRSLRIDAETNNFGIQPAHNKYILGEDQDMVYFSPFLPNIEINGFAFLKENKYKFCRLLAHVTYPKGVEARKYFTSGGRLRFMTNSKKLRINVDYGRIESYNHFPLTGTAGIDVFTENKSGKNWLCTLVPRHRFDKHVTQLVDLPSNDIWKSIVINYPTYAEVRRISLGIDKGSKIDTPLPYTINKPIVFYGSSITQGCAASKSSNNFPELVSRYFNADYINLGFSSSALGEMQLANIIAQIDMSAFVMEYDHNAPSVSHLVETHYNFYKTIRNQNPDIPIILISRISGGLSCSQDECQERVDVINATYRKAKNEGDLHIYFINGDQLISSQDRYIFLVDGKHPNDMGMYILASNIINILKHEWQGHEND